MSDVFEMLEFPDRIEIIDSECHSETVSKPLSDEHRCGVQTLGGKLSCERESGHDGCHVHFGRSGITAWGF